MTSPDTFRITVSTRSYTTSWDMIPCQSGPAPRHSDCSLKVSLRVKRMTHVGWSSGLHVVDEIKPINYKGLKETLEAGTGIEPVFTDLQSAA